ncbi:succinate dehydrogenase/fumarate reductase flavoprotein subunit [candidate division KSB1 bacterium]|nr:MAG: succinate dehydrogenase/fumarate reductase flavoprotein subunit [candidate division KSB1 bacterium]
MRYHQAVVVGGGLAGLRAAVALNQRNIKVAVISKVHPIRSHSNSAQGGINAPLGNHPRGCVDSPERHAFDTIKGSDYLADQDAVMRLTKDAAKRIIELEHWGCPFSRTIDGKIAQRPFGGAGFPRTCYAADRTGKYILHTLWEQIIKYIHSSERENMTVYDEWFVTSIVVKDGVCHGVIAMDLDTGELEEFKADAVIFATGGSGRVYKNTTNSLISTGLGVAIPFREGIPLKDMEFIQFHPTTLYGNNILMTEGCRGEGGYLLNNKGERFLANYDDSRKAMEVAPRDIIARNMMREILAGRGFEDAYLHLDLRHLGAEKINTRLPGIRELAINFVNVDPIDEPIPVQPGMHYTMGGIDTNINCETIVKGFYAAGECACVSVHGANRLGGNSLLETVVFGTIAGESAADYILEESPSSSEAALKEKLGQQKIVLMNYLDHNGEENHAKIKEELGTVMKDKVGIFRKKEKMEEALEEVRKLKERYKDIKIIDKGKRMNFDLIWAMELGGNLEVAEVITMGALKREESRGSHYRLDFPERDDKNWLKHTVAFSTPEGVKLEYKDVTLGFYEPRERKY